MGNELPSTSVRGRIRGWIVKHADLLGDDVLEVGSRIHDPRAWWCTNRDLAIGAWLGIDLHPGPGVDEVHDLELLPEEWSDRFSGVLCSEVLEHVRRPAQALLEARRVLRRGGWMVVTTLTAFPLHAFPYDYRRWTEAGLAEELLAAGFEHVTTQAAGLATFQLSDHGEPVSNYHCPIHVFGIARKP